MIFQTWMDGEGRHYFTDALFLDENNQKKYSHLKSMYEFRGYA